MEFKRKVVQEYLAGETLHGLSWRHDISPQLVRVWIEKYEAGAFDDDAHAADLIQQHEARIAALERLVGKQALELEFLERFPHELNPRGLDEVSGDGYAELRDDGLLNGEISLYHGDASTFAATRWTSSTAC